MRFLSVASGIECASLAWSPLGWSCVAVSEVDPFCRAVLAHHWPALPNLGDMTNYHEWPDANCDVLVGGTPCQTYSLAGGRKGLDDPRGYLLFAFVGIAARYRPRWLVLENVPGILSANRGWDFAAFLRMLGELGYGFAWRSLNARHFGLAQQRERVFLVACAGGVGPAAAVLFDRASLLRGPEPRAQAWQAPAGALARGDALDHWQDLIPPYVAQAVSSKWHKGTSGPAGDECHNLVVAPTSQGLRVRRLIPLECERLQGIPDNYTLVPYRGSPAKDGPRLRAIGNAFPVHVVRWIGERIELVESVLSATPPMELAA